MRQKEDISGIRIAVVGVGRMGRRHITAIRQLGLEIAGVCDPDPEALASASKEHQLTPSQLFRDAGELLRQCQPECVVVATTAPAHCEMSCLAAAAGTRYILCEKPMATSLEECDTLIEAVQRSGTRLAINHPIRFLEIYTRAKEAVTAASFGGLTSATIVAGNVGLAMNGTHLFEMFRFLTDEAPHEVTAWFSPGSFPNPRGPQFQDHAGAVRMTTASGRRFYLEASSDQGHGFVTIYAGPYGQLRVDELAGEMHLCVRQTNERTQPLTRYACAATESRSKVPVPDPAGGSRAVLEALLKGENYPTGEEGRLAIEVLVAAYASHENGHVPVRLQEASLPRERRFPWP